MPPAVISPGTIAILAPAIVMALNAIGLAVDPELVNGALVWISTGIGIAAALVGVYRHWREKQTVTTLSHQVVAAGGIPLAGPAKGIVPTQAAMAGAAQAVRQAARLAILLALPLLLGACTLNQAGQDARDRLASISLADVDQALQWADLNQDTAATQCFTAMRRVVVQLQGESTVGALTTFQLGMDITNPAGFLNTACAAERQAIKDRVSLFAGKAATLAASFGL